MKYTIELDFGKEPFEYNVNLDDLLVFLRDLAKKSFSQIDMPRYEYLHPKIKVERA